MAKLGTSVAHVEKKITAGPPPVVLQAQATGHIALSTPEEIAQWEADVKHFYGLGNS